MKLAVITDTHFGVKGDNQVIADHISKFYDDVFFPTLKREGIDTIIHAGDVFDRRKFINFLTLQKANKHFFDPMTRAGIHMHVIPGNHDCYFKNTNETNSLTELLKDKSCVTLYETPTEKIFDGLKVLMLPWINPENEKEFMQEVQSSSAEFLVAHLELAGFEMHKGQVNEHGMSASAFSKFSKVLTGHFHTPSEKGDIKYLGSPYEMTWADHGDKKGFYILDTTDRSLTFVENPYKLHTKIYYNDEQNDYDSMSVTDYKDIILKVVVEKKTNHAMFNKFIDRLTETRPLNLTIVEDLSIVVENEGEQALESASKDTLTLMDEYVDDIKTEVNVASVKNILKNLYNEATQI